MKSLTDIIEAYGYSCIRTYIQSGNIVFKDPHAKVMSFPKVISKAIRDSFGFQPHIIILSVKELKRAMNANPFPKGEKSPKSLHLYFLDRAPKHPDLEGLNKLKSPTESFKLIKNTFYLYAPDGIGRSKLASRVEALLGVEATARNWNTVTKLLEMANEKGQVI